ncbi:hypothetical protein Tsubulata_035182 [Turnera subulata]|uniref:FRIGIDA-like protein n=1 Tax=Turnera subulata TaxID=218843 RepID=A0A9Q0F1U6_9ROSI|nr:hypothetical protein Tsubulata_035182 [Turnera subulata]
METTMDMDPLKLAQMKQEEVHRCMDEVQAKASSFLEFTLQWKDLEAYLDSWKASLQMQEEELDLKEKKLGETAKLLEEREKGWKAKRKMFERCLGKLVVKQKRLDALVTMITKCEIELDSKKKKISECDGELKLAKQSILEHREELGLVRKSVKDLDDQLQTKEKHLASIKMSIEEFELKLDSKRKEFCSAQEKMSECNRQLGLIEQTILEHTEELGLVTNSVKDLDDQLQTKEKHSASIKMSIEEFELKLDSKRKEFGAAQEKMSECNRQLGLIEQSIREHQIQMELDSVKGSLKDCCEELESKKEELGSIQRILEKNKEKGKSLPALEADLFFVMVSFILGSSLATFRKMIVPPEDARVSDQICPPDTTSQATSIADALPSSQRESIGEHELMHFEVSDALRLFPDPAEFVLEMMQVSYSQEKIFLLNQLTKVLAALRPQVKGQAKRLADIWKRDARLETENSGEVLALLQFQAIYVLEPLFRDDILRLVEQKHTPGLTQAFSTTDKITVYAFLPTFQEEDLFCKLCHLRFRENCQELVKRMLLFAPGVNRQILLPKYNLRFPYYMPMMNYSSRVCKLTDTMHHKRPQAMQDIQIELVLITANLSLGTSALIAQ